MEITVNKPQVILASTLFALGCNTKDADTGDGTTATDAGTTTADGGATGTDTGTDTGTTTADGGTTGLALGIHCAWSSGSLTIDLVHGDPAGYRFGIAETSCSGGECWTAEDCYLGYTLSDGSVLSYCHPLSRAGGQLTTVSLPTDIVEGSTTLLSSATQNTYYLKESSSGECWVWGQDTSYYGALGCSDMGGGCAGD